MGVLPPIFQNHNEGVKQHGKEQQLHMFPDGLVNRREKTDNRILPGPVIKEVGQRSCQQNKNDADDCTAS